MGTEREDRSKRHFVTNINTVLYLHESGAKGGYVPVWLEQAARVTDAKIDLVHGSDAFCALYHTGRGLSEFWNAAHRIREEEWDSAYGVKDYVMLLEKEAQ